ncbi:MAG: hypothetical protein EOP47_22050 [Sphingobacteriaceae bacterium]|nr:MAG: hypothetical protein EOP47_22050 [Sphingobacteriaceae bacterium]
MAYTPPMRNLNFIILLAIALTSCDGKKPNFPRKTEDNTSFGIKVPSAWINRVRHLEYSTTNYKNDSVVLAEFFTLIEPDTLHGTDINTDFNKVLNMIFADIDNEPGEELIGILGYDVYSPELCVMKEIKGEWYIIYKEKINTFYKSPSISIANNHSKNKVFYLRRVYNHGSGVYLDRYTFYKLINGKVYSCLNIINRASIVGWGLYINQEVQTNFEFADSTDELGVTYNYTFFPGSIYSTDCPWCMHDEIPLISGNDNVSYIWDEKTHTYKLDIPAYKNDINDLTSDKISCFGDFGNDSLFVSAYKKQIDEKLKKGTPQQQKILNEYLRRMQTDNNKINKPLEQKSKAGGTTFYGPSN